MTRRSWDCHTHVFGPYDQFPLDRDRNYTPPQATVAQLRAHLDALGLDQVVLVQPHSHGVDARAMMAALTVLGDRGRAVTVVDPETITVDHLAALRDRGVRGVRVNAHTAGSPVSTPTLTRLTDALAAAGLHLQLFASGSILAEVIPRLGPSVPVVVDHMGMALHDTDPHDAARIVEVLCDHGCWIKLSAPERMGVQPDDPRVHWLVTEFAERVPDRIVWGSDWPHSALSHSGPVEQTEPFRRVDDRARLDMLSEWLGTERCGAMLYDNAEALYA